MPFTPLETQVIAAIDRDADELIRISRNIHANPELEDLKSSSLRRCSKPRSKNAGLRWKTPPPILKRRLSPAQANAGPTIGILAEYDALLGL